MSDQENETADYVGVRCVVCGWCDGFRSDLVADGKRRFYCDRCDEETPFEVISPPVLLQGAETVAAAAVRVAERLKKEVADLKKERDMWIFNAQELQKGFNNLDKERKHWLGDLEQIQELKARVYKLTADNALLREALLTCKYEAQEADGELSWYFDAAKVADALSRTESPPIINE